LKDEGTEGVFNLFLFAENNLPGAGLWKRNLVAKNEGSGKFLQGFPYPT
jgi:hypothetical protein